MAGSSFFFDRSPVTPKITKLQGPAMRGNRRSRGSRSGFAQEVCSLIPSSVAVKRWSVSRKSAGDQLCRPNHSRLCRLFGRNDKGRLACSCSVSHQAEGQVLVGDDLPEEEVDCVLMSMPRLFKVSWASSLVSESVRTAIVGSFMYTHRRLTIYAIAIIGMIRACKSRNSPDFPSGRRPLMGLVPPCIIRE